MKIFDKFRMDGKVCIVTGGAVGLGYAMAVALAQAGAHIVIADIDEKAARTAVERLTDSGLHAMAVQVDVTNAIHIARMVESVVERFGRIDVLFNNAGICIHTPAEQMPFQDWMKVMDVNLNGVFLVSQAVGNVMIRQRSGVIINIASMSGIIANTPQKQAAYNVSKAGVIMLTKSLAFEWADYNIRVNAIAPGYMKTEMTAPYFEENGSMVKTWMEMTPMNRPGLPEELQGVALYLASEASSYATGAVFTIDGGYTVL